MKLPQYRKEFFDREYSAGECYGRYWRYAKKYRFRIVIGIVCGLLTAGTLLPFYQVIQPTLAKVNEAPQAETAQAEAPAPEAVAAQVEGTLPSVEAAPGEVATPKAEAAPELKGMTKEMRKNSKLPGWYPKVEKLAAKIGVKTTADDGGMGGALVLLVVFIVPLVALARMTLMYLNHYCLNWAAAHVVADLRQDILRHVQRQGMQFFGRIDVGQLISRATGDPQSLQILTQQLLAELALAPLEIVVSIGYIIWFAIANEMLPTLALIAIGFPMFMLPIVTVARRIRKWSKRTLERNSMITSKIHEILTCVKVVKAYDTEAEENEKYAAANKTLLKSTLRTMRLSLAVGPCVETVGILLICAFVVWCFFAHVTLANVVPMLAPLLIIYKPLKQLSKMQSQIEQGRAALSRIYSILDVSMELPEKADPVRVPEFKDRISFKDVSFRYDTATEDSVKHATFDIPRGKVVAVVGGTGSGKSTMSGLLARFFDPREGTVAIDGIDLRDVKISDLRALIGSVMQETLLFNDTIEANIRYGSPNATHEEVVAAAKMANAHDFIMAQPEGYNRLAGEKGFALSGGERQRIAIARAILKNPPILILDEATSALDTVTERLVQEAIDNLMSHRTTFAIAHRLSTIRSADLILVMDKGEIVERGTHDELYALGGMYRKLCDMQLSEG